MNNMFEKILEKMETEKQLQNIKSKIKKLAKRDEDNLRKKHQELIKNLETNQKKTIFYYKTIFNNEKLMGYIRKNNIPATEIAGCLQEILNKSDMFHLGKRQRSITVREANESIYIQSGYFKILSESKLHPDISLDEICLITTEKGRKLFREYSKISK